MLGKGLGPVELEVIGGGNEQAPQKAWRGWLGYPCGPGAPLLAGERGWEPEGAEVEAEGAGHPCQDQCITPHLVQGYGRGPEAS